MHLSETKFKTDESGNLSGYCGDFNPPQPSWSILSPGKKDSEVGIYLYFTVDREIERVRYVLNDTVYEKNCITAWYLYLFSRDKKYYGKKVPRKVVIFNEYNPTKLRENELA
jgi:hypothetical protein